MLLKHDDEQPELLRTRALQRRSGGKFIVLTVHVIENFGVPLLPPVVRIYRLAVLYLHSEPQLIIASISRPKSCH